MSHNIDEVPSGRTVENNVVASLIFEPTVDQIEVMASKLWRLGRCDGASLDVSAMVFIKSVLEVDFPWGIQNITTQYYLLLPLLYLNIPMGNLKHRFLR